MTELKDKTLVCKDCSQEFVFSASEQDFYKQKGFENEPSRCPECRSKRKKNMNRGGREGDGQQKFFTVNCSACGKETQVPFKPVQEKPVYCRECFMARKQSAGR